MDKVTIAKSIAGLALAGGTATGIALLAFPQSKQLTEEELEAKRKISIQKRKQYRISEMYEIYKKNTAPEDRTLIATTIGGYAADKTTFHFENDKFVEDDIVVTAIDGWCTTGAKNHEALAKYPGFNKDRLCDWEEI